jgi:hypothetical protein
LIAFHFKRSFLSLSHLVCFDCCWQESLRILHFASGTRLACLNSCLRTLFLSNLLNYLLATIICLQVSKYDSIIAHSYLQSKLKNAPASFYLKHLLHHQIDSIEFINLCWQPYFMIMLDLESSISQTDIMGFSYLCCFALFGCFWCCIA